MWKLLAAAKKYNFNSIKPDPERLEPLRNMHKQKKQKSKERAIGMFSYYCQFIKSFSDKIQPLVKVDRYPINSDTEITFYQLKKDIEASVVTSTDDTLSLVVETHAS